MASALAMLAVLAHLTHADGEVFEPSTLAHKGRRAPTRRAFAPHQAAIEEEKLWKQRPAGRNASHVERRHSRRQTTAAIGEALQAQGHGLTMNHTLIVGAGLGTTGTTSLNSALVQLGLTTLKWNFKCSPNGTVRSPVLAQVLRGKPYGRGMFGKVDAVLDTGYIELMPHILKDASYAQIKLILTVRNCTQWAARRANLHPCAPPPFLLWYSPSSPRCVRPSLEVLEHGCLAWEAYVRRVAEVYSLRLLVLDIFKTPAATLWWELEEFLGQPHRPRGRFA